MNISDLQQQGLEILKEVSDVFEKNNIKYFLAYGTQLGATRHKDVIPWDYDFDIACFIEDFQKIKDVLSNLDYDIEYNQETKNNKTLASIVIYSKNKCKYYREQNVGMYLDVFLFDKAPKQTKFIKTLYKLLFFKYSINRKVHFYGFRNLFKILRLENFSILKSIIFIFGYLTISCLVPLIYWLINSKKQDDIYSYSNKANLFGLDVEKFVYPEELINRTLVKKAKIKEYNFYEFDNVEDYLNLAFTKKWKQPLNDKQIKNQIISKFPKVITDHKKI